MSASIEVTLFTWMLTVASFTATILNIHGRRICFAIWIGTNSAWAVLDWAHGLPAQSALGLAYVGLAAYGLRRWSSRSGQQKSHAAQDPA